MATRRVFRLLFVLTRVCGANSLWVESAPGRADFKPIDALPGHACRFYGSRCRHFTVENASDRVSVRFDFRVLPRSCYCEEAETRSQFVIGKFFEK